MKTVNLNQIIRPYFTKPQRVRVIVLISEDSDSDETPTEEAIEGIHEGIREALSGKTIPLSQMWDGIDIG